MNIPEKKQFNRKVIVGLLLASAFLMVLNQTLLVIAIPPLMEVFHIDANKAQWVTTAFMLTNGILIPITAFLIEKYSSRALLITALTIFTMGTILGAVAPTFSIVIVARVIQAIGAGMMMPLMQTIILIIYPPEKRGAAMGLVGLTIAFAPAIGPTLSGWVIDNFSWRYLFYLLIPISIIVLVFTIFFMKNVTEQRETRIDILSVILSTFGWGGLLYGFSMIGSYGWGDRTVIISLFVGGVTLFMFIMRQLRLKKPMLEFRVFQSRTFRLTTILSVLIFALMLGVQSLLPIYTQTALDASALKSGLILLPGAIMMGIMSPITGKVFDKIGVKQLAVVGTSFILISNLLFLNLKGDTSILYIVIVFTVMMLGMSMVAMPLMTAGINALPKELIPHGTAVNNTIRMVGGSIGTALLISIMSSSSSTSSVSESVAVLTGLQSAFIVTSAIAFIGLLISFSLKTDHAKTDPLLKKQENIG